MSPMVSVQSPERGKDLLKDTANLSWSQERPASPESLQRTCCQSFHKTSKSELSPCMWGQLRQESPETWFCPRHLPLPLQLGGLLRRQEMRQNPAPRLWGPGHVSAPPSPGERQAQKLTRKCVCEPPSRL